MKISQIFKCSVGKGGGGAWGHFYGLNTVGMQWCEINDDKIVQTISSHTRLNPLLASGRKSKWTSTDVGHSQSQEEFSYANTVLYKSSCTTQFIPSIRPGDCILKAEDTMCPEYNLE